MDDKEQSYRKIIGKKIKLARARSSYTQEVLAEKLQLSTRYISKLERGISFGSATTLVNLCNALEINADFLFNELINCNTSEKSTDDNFFNNYLQLNLYHQKIINSFVKDLLQIQSNNTLNNTAN